MWVFKKTLNKRYLIFYLLFSVTIVSCQANKIRDRYEQINDLTRLYFNADYEKGKDIIERIIDICSMHTSPNIVWIYYGRLYVLERNEGNVENAELAFIKSKYWFVRFLEDQGLSNDEIFTGVIDFTPELLKKKIQKLDEAGKRNTKIYEELIQLEKKQ